MVEKVIFSTTIELKIKTLGIKFLKCDGTLFKKYIFYTFKNCDLYLPKRHLLGFTKLDGVQ